METVKFLLSIWLLSTILLTGCLDFPTETPTPIPATVVVPQPEKTPTATAQTPPDNPPPSLTPTVTAEPPPDNPAPSLTPTVTAQTPPDGPPPTQAPFPTRIEFELGQTSVALQSLVEPGFEHSYLFRVFGGQQITINLDSTTQQANFSLVGVEDGQPLKRIVNEDRVWQGNATITQDYRLEVVTVDEPTVYWFELEIAPLAAE